MQMENKDLAVADAVHLDGRVLEIESNALVAHMLAPFSELALSPEYRGMALECLLHRWVLMTFGDCPELMDGVLDNVGQFVREDIAEVYDGETDYLN